MKLNVIALDYDGTIALHGVLDPEVRSAAIEARERGVRVVIVTGRIVSELERVAGALDWVDGVVAENGAVAWLPARQAGTVLAGPPPTALVEGLVARGHAVVVGSCVVELDAAAAHDAIEVIRALELPHVLQFNQDRLMLLPQGISKAVGFRALLDLLGLSRHEALAIGNAENDYDFLACAGYGVAVRWGSPALAGQADHVLEGDGPPAVAALMREFVRREWLPPARAERDAIVIGTALDGSAVSVPAGRNVIIAGEKGTGRSWIARSIAEQHLVAHRVTVVLDAASGLRGLETFGRVAALGNHALPAGGELARALERADAGVIVDPAQLPRRERHVYLATLLALLGEWRRNSGRPHVVVVDELHELREPSALEWERGGYVLVVRRASQLPRELVERATLVITRESDPDEARALRERLHGEGPERVWAEALAGRDLGEAVWLEGPRPPTVFRVAPTLTAAPAGD